MTLPERPDLATLRGIRMLLLDVDGVLTDGRLHFDADGRETKTFHVLDGAGIAWWNKSGGLSGLLTGRAAPVVAKRAEELGIHECVMGRLDKDAGFETILARRQLQAREVAYIGDDLLDLPVLARAGFAVAPANGREEVRARVHYVTRAEGGNGAVREVVEILLRAKGLWEPLVARGGLP